MPDPASPARPHTEPQQQASPAGPPGRALRAAWPLAAAAGAVLPAVAVLLSGRTLAWRDTASLLGPIRPLVVDALRAARLPLWNPHEVFGIPLLAQMIHGALHPVSIAAALVAPRASMDVLIVVYVAVAALGASWLARTLGGSAPAAATAGLAYGASGYVLGMSAVLTYLGAAATAPWVVGSLRRAGERRRWGVVLAAVAVASQHLAGDPQWTVVAVALGAVLAADAGGLRGVSVAGIGVAMGTAAAAVQLAPAWAFLPETLRSGGLSQEDRLQWALAPWRLVELVAPGFFDGHPGVSLTSPVFLWLGGPTQPALRVPFVPSVFVGAAVLALAVVGARASRAVRSMAVAGVVLAWIALGAHAGAEQLLHALPVWRGFRYTEKLTGPLTLVLAVLAGLGADRIAAEPRRRGAAVAAAMGALALALAAAVHGTSALETLAPGGAPAEAVRSGRDALARGLVHAGAALAALAALWLGAVRSRSMRRRFPAATAALVLLASAAAAPYALHAGARGAVAERPLAGIVAADPFPRVETPLDAPPYRSPVALDDADLDAAVRSRMAAAPFGVPAGIDHVSTYTGLLPRRPRALGEALGPDLWRTLRRFAVTHVVLKEPATEAERAVARDVVHGASPVGGLPEWGISVFAVPHRAWASFASRVAFAASEREALDAFIAADLAGLPTVVLQGGEPARAATSPGRVLAVERGAERVRVVAQADGDGVLVVNDAWWPGWRATLDGVPVPILRADFLVRAVAWPAGRHVLDMRYDPPEVGAGWAITAAGLLAIGAAALLAARARRAGRLS